MPDEDAGRERQKEMELDILRHWRVSLAACKGERDGVTFLAALAVNIEQLLLAEYPGHAEAWLSSLDRRVREELQLREQVPN